MMKRIPAVQVLSNNLNELNKQKDAVGLILVVTALFKNNILITVTLLHLERPKLHKVLAHLSAAGLRTFELRWSDIPYSF